MVEMKALIPKKKWAKVGEEEGDHVAGLQEEVMMAIGMVSGQTTICMTVPPQPVGSVPLLYRVWIWLHYHHANGRGMMAQAQVTWNLLAQDPRTEEQVDHHQERKVDMGHPHPVEDEVVGAVVDPLTGLHVVL